MMLMPVLMGGAMFAMMRIPMSLIFMLGFPAMMFTSYLVQRRQAAKEHAEEATAWRQDVQQVLDRLDRAAELQRHHRSEEHTSVLQSRGHLVCPLLLEKKNIIRT